MNLLKPFDLPARRLTRIHKENSRLLVADLVRRLGPSIGLSVTDPEFPQRLADLVAKAAHAMEPHLLFGKRVEALFPYVVAQLGRSILISEEGAGEVWSTAPLVAPDWRVVLPDIGPILVEVKNCHDPQFNFENAFAFSQKQHARVQSYADLVRAPLFYAIYWPAATRWTLVAAGGIPVVDKNITITYGDAQDRDEMSILGDFMLGLPTPVTIDLIPQVENRPDVVVFRSAGMPLGEAAAALVADVVENSRCDVESSEIQVNGTVAQRFTLKTRVHDEGRLVCEPLSAMITHRALNLNAPRGDLPTALHAPTDPYPILELIERAEKDGFKLDRFIFANSSG